MVGFFVISRVLGSKVAMEGDIQIRVNPHRCSQMISSFHDIFCKRYFPHKIVGALSERMPYGIAFDILRHNET
jgi:hypothetical protein